MRRLVLLLLCFCLYSASTAAADAVSTETTDYRGNTRTYYLDIPETAKPPSPLVVLLHGSGGNGEFMLEQWKDVAAREGVVLLAPNSLHADVGWDLDADGPDYIHQLIGIVAAKHPIDFRRIYVFGQSGGAVYALTLAMLESQFFAAVAFHAGGWRRPAEYKAMDYAKRKIPITMYLGDRDEYFSLSSVEHTERALTDAGFPVALNVLPGRHHSYLDVPAEFNQTVWNALKGSALTDEPNYTVYR